MALPIPGSEEGKYIIGDLGLALLLASTLALGFIATGYQLFPQYATPIIFTVLFGWIGLFFATATGALAWDFRPIKTTVIFASFVVLFMVAGLGALLSYTKPQSSVGSLLLLLPVVVTLIFFPSVGVLEEGFWRGLFMGLRKKFPGVPLPLIIAGISVGGMAYHQFVAFSLFKGTIFSSPDYFLWIGGSWAFYCLVIEYTKNFAASATTHWVWNFVITYQSLRQQGLIP